MLHFECALYALAMFQQYEIDFPVYGYQKTNSIRAVDLQVLLLYDLLEKLKQTARDVPP